MTVQKKQSEWYEQWKMLEDDEIFLFKEWIQPYTLEVFRDKDVLDCGCGGGQHTSFVAPYARHVTAVDLNTADIARQRNKEFDNVEFVEADIMNMDLGRKFDIVFCIGVIHHTDSPEKAAENMKRHLKNGGILIIWTYSEEGNWMVKNIVEPLRKMLFAKIPRNVLWVVSRIITAIMYIPIYTLYLLPLKRLPFYEYFQNFRRLSFYRNALNVFDKLNAPQVDFISRPRAEAFVRDMESAKVLSYKGVSFSVSGIKRPKEAAYGTKQNGKGKRKKVLLLEPITTTRSQWGKFEKLAGYIVPLGMIALNNFLKSKVIDVDFIDTQFPDFKTEELKKLLLRNRYNIIGIPVFTNTAGRSFETAAFCKKILPKCKIVFGNVHATSIPERTFEECPDLDYIVRGEGEETFYELIRHEFGLNGRTNLADIKGIVYRRDNGEIVVNESRPLIQDVDSLPDFSTSNISLTRYIPSLYQ